MRKMDDNDKRFAFFMGFMVFAIGIIINAMSVTEEMRNASIWLITLPNQKKLII
jgi:hypothetical protein